MTDDPVKARLDPGELLRCTLALEEGEVEVTDDMIVRVVDTLSQSPGVRLPDVASATVYTGSRERFKCEQTLVPFQAREPQPGLGKAGRLRTDHTRMAAEERAEA